MSEYWLISAPGDKTCQQTWETMNNVTNKQNNLCENFKFHIPDLKVSGKIWNKILNKTSFIVINNNISIGWYTRSTRWLIR